MIWAVFTALAVLATAIVLFPVVSGRRAAPTRGQVLPAILADQLAEVERDRDRGLISTEEAKAAELEIKRRLLTVARRDGTANAATPALGGKLLVILAALATPAFAFGFYALRGEPQIASLAYADRTAEREERARVSGLAAQLLARLEAEPDGGATEGWMLLGQTYSRMGRAAEAANAFERIATRPDATSEVWSRLGEAVINAENGIVTPRAMEALDRSLALNPDNPAGSYYKAVGLSQAGAEPEAYDLLVARLERAEGYEPWMDIFIGEINRLGQGLGREPRMLADLIPNMPRGPSAEDVANASEMSVEDRAAFVESMVARLAERLAEQPDDLDGWLRLGNAYVVLERPEEALAAFRKAEPLVATLPADDPRREAVQRALAELKG